MSQRRVLEHEPAAVIPATPVSQVEQYAVRQQLERLLAHPLFSHSKRYPLLLRWVVERALEGRASQLKERILGVEVFGRDPDYDTNTDPVVRITAGEIRKRIAQYYHEPGRSTELRIDLPTGSYVPEFHRPPQLVAAAPVAPPVVVLPAPEIRPKRRSRHWYRYAGVLALPLLIWLAVWLFSTTPLERFWRPFFDFPGSVLLCIGGTGIAPDVTAAPPPDQAVSVTEQIHHDYVSFQDATTLSRLAGLFQAKGQPYNMRIATSTTFADMRNAPLILVGGFNNGWTMRLLSQLRFGLGRDPATHEEWIEDRQNPGNRDWKVNCSTPNLTLTDDYAIITRYIDPSTEKWVVVAAGIVQYGTIAAGEFLTDPRYLGDLAKRAPANWERKNMQVVIATKVINGNSGPPRILATYFW